jgi:photosystem II stability/assembly factor-like uncharacterized protein
MEFTMPPRVPQLLAVLLISCQLQAAVDSELLSGLKARSIGPAAVGGRITAIDVVTTHPNHIVIGTATGGVWMSDNGGLTWSAVFDDQPVASIGAVAINQDNPDIIWVGTGEGNVRNSTSIGGGMFKSIDGGKTWTRVGLEKTERINRIALHPDNPNVVYAAALGTLWGENTERGVFKTGNGGDSWEKILYVDEKTGATDVKLDPHNPDKVYASLWQHRRWPWIFKSGGPGSGMYISWDGGSNWSHKTEEDGLPGGELGRITFAPSAAQKDRIFALVEAKKSAMLRSDDGGESWQKVNQDTNIATRPFYYNEVAADPADPNRVYNIYTMLSMSIDGGKTFELNPVINCCAASNTIHIDNHAFWINPNDPSHLIIGNDGGIAISHDRGQTWRFVRNLPLSQFYQVAVDNAEPYNVYGGLQDNGSWRGPAEVRDNAGIRNVHWQEVGFGDGFDTLPDPANPRRGWGMSQGGYLYTWNLDNGEQRVIRPAPPGPDVELRFNWDAALSVDPFDPATIYYGSQFVHKSLDRGLSWTVISPDLTSNDPEKQIYKESGGITPDVTAAENHTTLTVISPSPLEQGLIWTGSDDGRIHITRDGGDNWERIDERARGVNPGAWVHFISPSPHQAGTAFVAFDDHRRSDMTAYFYRVEDYGRIWTRIGADLPGYAILQDFEDPDLLFAGTEFGLHFSNDGGESWVAFRAGVPTVSVMDMAIQKRENDLVLGTHGRGIFVIDDYSALRNLEEDDFSRRLKILSATEGLQYDAAPAPSTRFTGSGEFRADNEPFGVILTFLASGDDLTHPDEELERQRRIAKRNSSADADGQEKKESGKKSLKVKVTVSQTDGEVIRTFKSDVHQGINRITWNLRRDGSKPMPGPQAPEPDADLPSGARVPAGEYLVSLSLGKDEEAVSETISVAVVTDPRLGLSNEARQANYQALLDIKALNEQTVNAVERIVRAREDLDTVKSLISRRDDADDDSLKALKEQITETRKSLNDLEKEFRTPPDTKGIVYSAHTVASRVSAANGYVSSSMDSPTPDALVYIEDANRAGSDAMTNLESVFEKEVNPLSVAIEEAGIRLLSTSQ